ncbi:exonuclease SbcCD subunit D [Halomonas elongata]|uniref:Nuclease SbcCD subunit D n=1 Tax=Halomonas elongata (strain ATCC 33173 / DSM 2581 / NBRC 15536 / NCIMB 2198 / 1H9) TaxID=768066 RepID=E1V5B4_HALED|nr:exonuclease SbcCD subunit D C-terminal domain-containing protein [Halomonas elongata]WBF16809.1 exonuclease SbcCD subunit D C-terminal domain-containing protein [Halomonas elongata]WPU45640.1 exonuclease SbcCD subunit D C-terminal domain-containing protein [Halomonas elongata DSM 2581]CBV43069.1 nuclease SbcCD subunit D [Halomonas elongata DSM 2581]
MLKLIHTADWHLGQSFHGQERHTEHRAFLDWLLETLVEREADALLVAGDIFDVVNPSLRAQELLYDFIVAAHERLPQLDIVLIAGNHDSGNRIELPAPLMRRLRTHALGRVVWREDGELDADRLLVPLTDATGATQAWCLALPFLRPAEVTGGDADDYVSGISSVHERLIDTARRRREPGQALVAMSHAHLHGATVSEASERPIVIGGEESISAALFPDDIAYVALGHLHRAQQVGEPRIRYSGSPLPLDFSEVDYPHQVVEVSLDGERLAGSETLRVPRPVAMHRLGPAPLDEVLAELDALADDPTLPRERWPWLEVTVALDTPVPDLRARVESALEGKALRLLRLSRRLPHSEADTASKRVDLQTLGPRKLFERTWRERWDSPPDDDVLADFDRLHQEVLDDPEAGA